MEIINDDVWKEHIIEYAGGVNSSGIRCIDIGTALYCEGIVLKKKASLVSSTPNKIQHISWKKCSTKKKQLRASEHLKQLFCRSYCP